MSATKHRTAAIVSVGDELTLGENLDTNSRTLAAGLAELGIRTVEHVTIGDDEELLAGALSRLAGTVDLVISTGGLGPTADDLTRGALAIAAGSILELDGTALGWIAERFARQGRPMTEIQRVQAMRPRGAACIPNANGTAPGLHAALGACDVFCLPGPPAEMRPMFVQAVLPRLRSDPALAVRSRMIHLAGIGEADAARRLGALLARDRNPQVGITVSWGVVTLRIRRGAEGGASSVDIDQTAAEVRALVGEFVFGDSGDAGLDRSSIEEAVIGELAARGRTLATVESCTGGLLGGLISSVPGASRVFRGGLVTYANDVKSALAGVRTETLTAHGAVSREVAIEMARGGLGACSATNSAAITGVAGPEGGTPEKPVGTVWIATSRADCEASARLFRIPGDRDEVRQRAARTAAAMLYFDAREAGWPAAPLLWERPN